jgi:hypothetical protein
MRTFWSCRNPYISAVLSTAAVKLKSIAQSRTEPASRVERARILLAYRKTPRFLQWAKRSDCIIRPCSAASSAVAEGPLAALDDRPRPGREPTITIEAKTWLVDLLHDRGIRSNPRPIKGADDILEILELARGDAQPLR